MFLTKGYEYGASYDGCNGWETWLRDVIVVTANNLDELNNKKKIIEEKFKNKSDQYLRVYINHWSKIEELND